MHSGTQPTAETVSPVSGQERILSLDVLRGFAVLGILVMNVQSFSMVAAAYSNPHAFGDLTGANYAVWYGSQLLANLKFMGLFSMLFGAGIVVMADRRERRGLKVTGFHYRRIFWLLIIGLVHAYLIWYGDILVIYALCGAIVFWARRLRPIWLVALAVLLLCVSSGLSIFAGLSMPHWGPEQLAEFRNEWQPGAEKLAEEVALYRGNWLGQMKHRVPLAVMFHTFLFGFYFFWRVGGMMLLGMALQKMRILDASRSKSFYLTLTIVGAACGLLLIAYGIRQDAAHDWAVEYSFFLGPQFNYWGSLLVIAAYVGLVMLACQTEQLNWVTRRLAKTGQMALTNYLGQSVICTLIFYGHGLGQFGYFSRTQQIGLVVVVLVAQIEFSTWWLARFRFGPLEWLWRSLTYWRRQPMAIAAATSSA